MNRKLIMELPPRDQVRNMQFEQEMESPGILVIEKLIDMELVDIPWAHSS